MLNRLTVYFLLFFSATFLFTDTGDKLYSGLKKNVSNNKLIEYDKRKIESMKLMEKERFNKKMSKTAPNKVNYSAKSKLSKQLSFPSFEDKKYIQFMNDYSLEKLTYMKIHNLNNIHQSNKSDKDKLSLQIKYPIITANNNRDCSACEFDFTYFGSECCDSAWEEYGLNCFELESGYNWDCSGCECPG
ncbi:uncharacterized protein METZ01_LOCUS497929, partial [marine metagenome]